MLRLLNISDGNKLSRFSDRIGVKMDKQLTHVLYKNLLCSVFCPALKLYFSTVLYIDILTGAWSAEMENLMTI